ncbi:MAG: hypothetical protein AAF725_24770 [Acidobacteriota bacterium]
MSESDSVSVRGLGRSIMLPEGGMPFEAQKADRPAASPAKMLSVTVEEAFQDFNWDGTSAREPESLNLNELTAEKFFERFRWEGTA